MPGEREPQRIVVSGIHIDLTARAVTIEAEHTPLARISIAPEGIIFEHLGASASEAHAISSGEPASIPAVASSEQATTDAGAAEREHPVVLSGRLRSKPRQGRPDGRGNPTAWARFAAHDEEHEGAHMYSATFHRHTARLALGLSAGAPVTVEGYPHPSADATGARLDSFSVINLLDYPGKPEPKR